MCVCVICRLFASFQSDLTLAFSTDITDSSRPHNFDWLERSDDDSLSDGATLAKHRVQFGEVQQRRTDRVQSDAGRIQTGDEIRRGTNDPFLFIGSLFVHTALRSYSPVQLTVGPLHEIVA